MQSYLSTVTDGEAPHSRRLQVTSTRLATFGVAGIEREPIYEPVLDGPALHRGLRASRGPGVGALDPLLSALLGLDFGGCTLAAHALAGSGQALFGVGVWNLGSPPYIEHAERNDDVGGELDFTARSESSQPYLLTVARCPLATFWATCDRGGA